jgi:hypothetical protein
MCVSLPLMQHPLYLMLCPRLVESVVGLVLLQLSGWQQLKQLKSRRSKAEVKLAISCLGPLEAFLVRGHEPAES